MEMFERIAKALKEKDRERKRKKNTVEYKASDASYVHCVAIDGQEVQLPFPLLLTSDEISRLNSSNKDTRRKGIDSLFIRELYAAKGYVHEQEKDLERYNNRLKSLMDKVNALKVKVEELENR